MIQIFHMLKSLRLLNFDWRQVVNELKHNIPKFRTAIECEEIWFYLTALKSGEDLEFNPINLACKNWEMIFFFFNDYYKREMGEIFCFSNYIFIDNLATNKK